MDSQNETAGSKASILQRLVRLFGWAPPPTAWEGTCRCCRGRVRAEYLPADPQNVECLGCALRHTPASKERAAKREKIEIVKQALREIEAEKANVKSAATGSERNDHE